MTVRGKHAWPSSDSKYSTIEVRPVMTVCASLYKTGQIEIQPKSLTVNQRDEEHVLKLRKIACVETYQVSTVRKFVLCCLFNSLTGHII
jgi:hypothetical protein